MKQSRYERYRNGELVESGFVAPRDVSEPTHVAELRERLAEVEERLAAAPSAQDVATIAEAVDASLAPDTTPARKQTLRDLIRAMIDGAAVTPPKTPDGKDKP